MDRSEELLSVPGDYFPTPKVNRPTTIVTIDENFVPAYIPRNFTRQYCHSYIRRLRAARPKLEQLIKTEWTGVPLKAIFDLCLVTESRQDKKVVFPVSTMITTKFGVVQTISIEEKKTVALIGTIFKIQPKKPSILNEIKQDSDFLSSKFASMSMDYTSPDDTVQLQDDTTKLNLVFSKKDCSVSVESLVNGVVCAVMGRLSVSGTFLVTDVLFPTPSPALELQSKLHGDMVFVSGIEVGSGQRDLMLKIDLLFDTLQGLSGSPYEQQHQLFKRTKIYFLGNTFSKINEGNEQDKAIKMTAIHRMDQMLDDLSRTMDVFILPGENDPAEPTLPQLPIHRRVLPIASKRKTFRSLTNPSRITLSSSPSSSKSTCIDLMLSSGQNVTDAMRNCQNPKNSCEMALQLLQWGHQCPTAPDTLPLKPDLNNDVFYVDQAPHVYAVGNQAKFEAMDWQNTTVISVPKFAETGMAIILNDKMEAFPLCINLI